ncbi:MAG: type I restriction enzyme HsdR N-terminal domain-containing protein [Flavisolibacter sp.]|nr:type I restriction enzyme HsdR N-terminal domain-containing protein [Flavisolibacter sp.]
MIPISFPEPKFNIKERNSKQYIFDPLRKSWLLLTEEEWVRQNFVNYLINGLHYPATVIALEKGIQLYGLKKRFDVLVYNKDFLPWMLIECKKPGVRLNEEALQQALRYNISVSVPYIIITNGDKTIGWRKVEQQLELLNAVPAWS